MYTYKNVTYADAGKYLKCDNKIAFQMPSSDNFQEFDLDFSDIFVEKDYVFYNKKLFVQKLWKQWTYSDYKRDIIKKRYSNDDQIAIILNKDDSEEDLLRYQKMMEWREFASTLAKKIELLLNLENNDS